MCKKNMKIPAILLLSLTRHSLSSYFSLNSPGNYGFLDLARPQSSGGLLRGPDGRFQFDASSSNPFHALLMNQAMQTLRGYQQFQREDPPDVVSESSAARICVPWLKHGSDNRKNALQFLNEFDRRECGNVDKKDGECLFVRLVKDEVEGSLTPLKVRRTVVSEAVSYSGLPDEKRVTATIILNPESASKTPLGSLFEEFIAQRGNNKAEISTSRVRNAIKVNHRQEELSISADGGLDDIYVFSHSNDKTHSIWIVLYIGKTKKVADGRKLIEDFENNLIAQNIWISDSAVMTSEEEEKIEKEAENEEEMSSLKNLESTAQFALKIHCIAFRG